MNLQITGLKVDAGAGPGSRGGKIIGHTKSGKPVYMNHNHPSHKEFTATEHIQAKNVHFAASKMGNKEAHKKAMDHHQARFHERIKI